MTVTAIYSLTSKSSNLIRKIIFNDFYPLITYHSIQLPQRTQITTKSNKHNSHLNQTLIKTKKNKIDQITFEPRSIKPRFTRYANTKTPKRTSKKKTPKRATRELAQRELIRKFMFRRSGELFLNCDKIVMKI